MKELDELRNYINSNSAFIYSKGIYYMNNYIDYAEQAIAERYIKLPLDAEGKPWHIGDKVAGGHGTVEELHFTKHGWVFWGITAIDPTIHFHAKPDTIEDVLRELAQDAFNYGYKMIGDAPSQDALIAEYAERIERLTNE
jgi:hypothetical protein